jgi:mycothiol synthase
MKTVRVSPENVAKFVRYCRRYGAEHDESFLPDDSFVPTDDYPAYLLYAGNDVVGAVELMRPQWLRKRGRGRLAIFHSVDPSLEAYAAMLTAIRPHAQGLNDVYGFVPEAKADIRRCWEALGFTLERYAYLLAYRDREAPQAAVPEGYSMTSLERNDETGIRELCDLWNRNYEHQPGFVGATPEYIRETFDNETEYVPGGVLLLRHGKKAVGTAHVFQDNEEEQAAEIGAEIGMVSVHPDYRGQGLGRLMLRQALAVAFRNGFHPMYLSVNAENKSAVSLYLSEGFTEDSVMACYTLAMRNNRD